MAWILKKGEDILNRVDQQTNAVINQHNTKSTSKQLKEEPTSNSSLLYSPNKSTVNSDSTNRSRCHKQNDDSYLIDYLNSSTPVNNKFTGRTVSSPDMHSNDHSKSTKQVLSKSNSGTPRSTTPVAQSEQENEGLILVRLIKKQQQVFI